MAFVPGFEYDLYSKLRQHDIDDELSAFVQDLRVFLRRELGKDFSDAASSSTARNCTLRPYMRIVEGLLQR
jgi:hypothetical protein